MLFDMPTQEELDQRRAAKRVPASKAGWAEKKARNGVRYISCITDNEVYSLIAKLLKAEHARAIRMVKRQMGCYQRQRETEKVQSKRDMLAGSILACVGLLTALQRGRGEKG